MKKSLVVLFVFVIAVLSVTAVSADRNVELDYIMFWFESARDAIMGPGSNAPLGTNPVAAAINDGGDGAPTPAQCSAEDWAVAGKEEAFHECANRCYNDFYKTQGDSVLTYCFTHASPTNIKCDPDTGVWTWTCEY